MQWLYVKYYIYGSAMQVSIWIGLLDRALDHGPTWSFFSVIRGVYTSSEVTLTKERERMVEIVEQVVLQDRESHLRWDMATALQSLEVSSKVSAVEMVHVSKERLALGVVN